jgi:hypothetical protein
MAIKVGDCVVMHGANGTFNNMALEESSLQWTRLVWFMLCMLYHDIVKFGGLTFVFYVL